MSGELCRTTSFPANSASCQFILNHGRDYRRCMSLPVVEEGETLRDECPSFMGSWYHLEAHEAFGRDIVYYIIDIVIYYIIEYHKILYIDLRESQTATITFSSMLIWLLRYITQGVNADWLSSHECSNVLTPVKVPHFKSTWTCSPVTGLSCCTTSQNLPQVFLETNFARFASWRDATWTLSNEIAYVIQPSILKRSKPARYRCPFKASAILHCLRDRMLCCAALRNTPPPPCPSLPLPIVLKHRWQQPWHTDTIPVEIDRSNMSGSRSGLQPHVKYIQKEAIRAL